MTQRKLTMQRSTNAKMNMRRTVMIAMMYGYYGLGMDALAEKTAN